MKLHCDDGGNKILAPTIYYNAYLATYVLK